MICVRNLVCKPVIDFWQLFIDSYSSRTHNIQGLDETLQFSIT